ncbi:MAG: ferrous iron transport protein A [Ruminococcus sp.]
MMPLMFANPGDEVTIKRLAEVPRPKAPGRSGLCGWRNTYGGEFRQRKSHRQCQETRIAITKEMAAKIMI